MQTCNSVYRSKIPSTIELYCSGLRKRDFCGVEKFVKINAHLTQIVHTT